MTKIAQRNLARVQHLCDQHDAVTAALTKVGKKGYSQGLNVSDEGNDYTDVSLDRDIARAALLQQKGAIELALQKLGIEVS